MTDTLDSLHDLRAELLCCNPSHLSEEEALSLARLHERAAELLRDIARERAGKVLDLRQRGNPW